MSEPEDDLVGENIFANSVELSYLSKTDNGDATGTSKYKFGKKLKTPFPEFKTFDELADTEEGTFSALSVSMPVSYPNVLSPNVHDRPYSPMWCPGVNLFSDQANDIFFAAPMWEGSGGLMMDVISNRSGEILIAESMGGSFDYLPYVWNIYSSYFSGNPSQYAGLDMSYVFQNFGAVDFGQASIDITKGFTVSFWTDQWTNGSFGSNGGTVFSIGNFAVVFDDGISDDADGTTTSGTNTGTQLGIGHGHLSSNSSRIFVNFVDGNSDDAQAFWPYVGGQPDQYISVIGGIEVVGTGVRFPGTSCLAIVSANLTNSDWRFYTIVCRPMTFLNYDLQSVCGGYVKITSLHASDGYYKTEIDTGNAPQNKIVGQYTNINAYGTHTGPYPIQVYKIDSSNYATGLVMFALNVDSGRTIANATLTLYAQVDTGGTPFGTYPCSFNVSIVDLDQNPMPTLINRIPTGYLYGSVSATVTDGTGQVVSIDVTDLVQHVINRPGWLPSDQLLFLLTATSGAVSFASNQTAIDSPPGEGLVDAAVPSNPPRLTVQLADEVQGCSVDLYINGEQYFVPIFGGDSGDRGQTDFIRFSSTNYVFSSLAEQSGDFIVGNLTRNQIQNSYGFWQYIYPYGQFSGYLKDLRIYTGPLDVGDIKNMFEIPEELYLHPAPVKRAFLTTDDFGVNGRTAIHVYPNVNDHPFPNMWCPGFNNFSNQAIGLKFATPLWEGSGYLINDVVNESVGQGYQLQAVAADTIWVAYYDAIEMLVAESYGTPLLQSILLEDFVGSPPTITDDFYYNVSTLVTQAGTDYLHVTANSQNGDGSPASGSNAVFVFTAEILPNSSPVASLTFYPNDSVFGSYPCTIRVYGYYNASSFTAAYVDHVIPAIPSSTHFSAFSVSVSNILTEMASQVGWTTSSNPSFVVQQRTLGCDFLPATMEFGTPATLTISSNNGISVGMVLVNVYDYQSGDTVDPATLFLPACPINSVSMSYPCSFEVRACTVDNAQIPLNRSEAATGHGNLTTSYVSATMNSGTDNKNLDVTAIVQEIVDRPGWVAGNSIMFYLTVTGVGSCQIYANGIGGQTPFLTFDVSSNPFDMWKMDPTFGNVLNRLGYVEFLKAPPIDFSNGGTVAFWANVQDARSYGSQFFFRFGLLWARFTYRNPVFGEDGTGHLGFNFANSNIYSGQTTAVWQVVDYSNVQDFLGWHHYAFVVEYKVGAFPTAIDGTGFYNQSYGTFATSNDQYDFKCGGNQLAVYIGLIRAHYNYNQGQTIHQSRIRFNCAFNTDDHDYSATGPVTFDIRAELADNASMPANGAAVVAATLTTAVTHAAIYDSMPVEIDVTSIVQEIVNRPGWVSGNHIVFHCTPTIVHVTKLYITEPGIVIPEGTSGSEITLYIDGKQFGTPYVDLNRPAVQGTYSSLILSSGALVSSININSLDGNLKDFRIYDEPLMEGQIYELIDNPEDLYIAPLPIEKIFNALGNTVDVSGGVLLGGTASVERIRSDAPVGTLNIHDRMFPDMWMPGINLSDNQSYDLQLAIPMWENGGNNLTDVMGGYIGVGVKRDSDGLLDMWKDYQDPDFGVVWTNSALVRFNAMSFDIRKGGTVTFWAKHTGFIPYGSGAQFYFTCGQFYVKFQNNAYPSSSVIMNYYNSAGVGQQSTAVWEINNVIGDGYMTDWNFFAFVISPQMPAYGLLTNDGYFTSSFFTDNDVVLLEYNPDPTVSTIAMFRFTLDVSRGQTLPKSLLTITPIVAGATSFPCTATLSIVLSDDATWPANYTDAASRTLFGSITVTFNDDVTPVVADVTSLINQVTSRSGWAYGNHVMFYLTTTAGQVTVGSLNYPSQQKAVLSVSKIGSTVKFYLNGKQYGQEWDFTSNPIVQTGTFVLGANSPTDTSGTTSFIGSMKDFRVYKSILPIGAMEDIYRNPEYLYMQPNFALRAAGVKVPIEETMNGGVLCDGSAIVDVPFNVHGGCLVGGSASAGVTITKTVTSTGVLANGTAGTSLGYSPSGGVSGDGTASVSTTIVMLGGSIVSGHPDVTGVTNEPPYGIELGYVKAGATANTNTLHLFKYVSDGEVILVSGTSSCHIGSATNNASGGVVIAGSSTANFKFFKKYRIDWKTKAEINGSLRFTWNVGKLAIYWYRVIGKGQSDPCLPTDPCCEKVVMNVHARTLAELCEKLSKRRFKFPIDTVQRFSRPAENTVLAADAAAGDNHDCNNLVDVQICGIPQCADFCIDEDIRVNTGFNMTVLVDAFKTCVADGAVYVAGSSGIRFVRNVPAFVYEATGDVTVAGEADCASSVINGRGGAATSGTAVVKSSRWTYVGGNWPDSTGSRFGTISASVPRTSSDQIWSLTSRALKNDGLFCSTDISYAQTSQLLIVSGFGFNVPEWAEVLSVIVSIDRVSSQVSVRDLNVYLVGGGVAISDNLAVTSTDWPLIKTVRTYGQAGWRDPNDVDYLGPFTADELNDQTFGVALRVRASSALPAMIAKVDSISVQITYQDPNGSIIRVSSDTGSTAKSPSYHNSATGRVVLRSTNTVQQSRYYINPIVSAGSKLGGSAVIQMFEIGSGGSGISGEALVTPYFEIGSGGTGVGGAAKVTPYLEPMSGGVSLNGYSIRAGNWKYVASGSVNTGGLAITPEKKFSVRSAGGVGTFGSALAKCSNWKWVSDGNSIVVSGSAGQVAGNIAPPTIVASFGMVVLETTATFLGDVDEQNATGLSETLSKCGCFTLPLIIELSHNFSVDNIFAQFLVRNGLSISKTLSMRYNETNDSWQTNLHYKGLAPDANSYETWNVICELQCTNIVGGIGIGRNIWKVAIQFVRKNLTTQVAYDTRVIIGVLPDILCGTVENQLDFQINYDTQLGIATVNPNATVYQSTIFDNIGLFKNVAWINSPELSLRISQSGSATVQQRVDLTNTVLNTL